MPFIKDDGIFIRSNVTIQILMLQPVLKGCNVAENDIFGAGDKLPWVGYYQGNNKAAGKDARTCYPGPCRKNEG
jgi:hypothetical protein